MLAKKLSHVPTLASLNIRYKKTFGHKFRDVIAACGSYLKPVQKYIFPNFLAVHYCYIIFVTIIASILMYPVRNQSYIDILFLAAGATTQGGLNTVDTNTLSLYQQIIVYITCVFCTPIVIHGCLAFVRLYWFERYFDGIRDSSKKNYKMRRTKTILGREMTSRTMSKMPQRPTRTLSVLPTSSPNDENFQDKLFSGKELFRKEGEDNEANDKPDTPKPKDKNGFDSNGSSWSSSNTVKENGNSYTHARGGLVFKEPGIKKPSKPRERFAGRRSSTDISPEDMYRSIQMMQGQHQEAREDEGPALVIGAPTDRRVNRNEEPKQAPVDGTNDVHHSTPTGNQRKDMSVQDSSINPHHTQMPRVQEVQSSPVASLKTIDEDSKMGRSNHEQPEANKPTIQFDVSAQPKRPSSRIVKESAFSIPRRGNQYRTKSNRGLLKHLPKGKELRQKLVRRLSSNSADGFGSEKRRSYTDDDEPADKDNMEEYFADNESDDDEEEHPNVNGEGKGLRKVPTTGEVEEPRRFQFGEMARSHTMDARQAKDLNQLAQTPEFQKMIYQDWKKKHKKPNPLRRKSWNAKKFENEYSAGFPWMQEALNADEDLSPGHDSGEVNSWHASSLDNVKSNVASDSDNEAVNQDSNSPKDQDSLDEEQGYYGLTIDPEFTSNARPAIARTMSTNYLSWQPTIGRNSAFTGLSKAQREELGGIEYTSIKLLCRILVIYYVGFLILSFVLIVPWILHQSHYREIVRENGVSPTWWGFFTAMSAFTDLGITVTRDSMLSFNKAVYPLVVMMWFIIVGNTGFPVLLRFIIWILFKLSPELSQFKENLGFLLDHPRRCFTLLFPSAATWWLLATLVALNGIDLVLFIILDFGAAVLRPLARGFRVLDGLFQAVSTRTAGFTVVDLSKLHPAIQVSYMLMMYVSVLPLAISIRRTNVYEEQSLGLYGEMATEDNSGTDSSTDSEASSDSGSRRKKKKKKKQEEGSNESFIGAHLRRQLSFDIWFLFLGLFIICLCEGGKIQDTSKPEFNVFAVLFEIVSAYGTVGLSLGFPNTNTSFSGQFTTLSKLVIIAMLIRGRHRGLPYALDRAIMLPSDRLEHIDHIEDLKLKRTPRNATNNVDPVTAYFKKRTGKLHRGFDRLRRSVAEPEEAHLDAYEQHNNSPNYNLPGDDERDYQLETVSPATHSAPSSVHSPGSIDSEQLTDQDSNHDSMHLTHPVSYQ